MAAVLSRGDLQASWSDFRACYGTGELAGRVEDCIRAASCITSVSSECAYATLQCLGVKTVGSPPASAPPPPPVFDPELLARQVCVECQNENLAYLRARFFPDGGRPQAAGESAVCGVPGLGESKCGDVWSAGPCTAHAGSAMVTVSHVSLRRDADWAGAYEHLEVGVPSPCMDCRVGDAGDPRCLPIFTHGVQYRCKCTANCPAELAAKREAELAALQLSAEELAKQRQAARRYRTLSSECLPWESGHGDRVGMTIADTVSRIPPFNFWAEIDFNGGANEGGSLRSVMDGEWERQKAMKERCENFQRDAKGDLNARLEIPCGDSAPVGWEPVACIPDVPPPPPAPPDPPRVCEWAHMTRSAIEQHLSAWVYQDPYNAAAAPEARGVRASCVLHNRSKSTPVAAMRGRCVDVGAFHAEAAARGLALDPVLDYLSTTHESGAAAREAVAVFVPKLPAGSRLLSYHDRDCRELSDVAPLEAAQTHFVGRYNQVSMRGVPVEEHLQTLLHDEVLRYHGTGRHTVRDATWGQRVQVLPGSEPTLAMLRELLQPPHVAGLVSRGERSFRIVIPDEWHFECPPGEVPAPTSDAEELELFERLGVFRCSPCPAPTPLQIIVGVSEECGRVRGACQRCATGSFANAAGDACTSCMLPEVPVLNAAGTRYECAACPAGQYPHLATPPFYSCADLAPLAVAWTGAGWGLQYAQYIEGNNYLYPEAATGLPDASFVDPATFALTACATLPEPPLNYFRDRCGVPGRGLWVQVAAGPFAAYVGVEGMLLFEGGRFSDGAADVTDQVSPPEAAVVTPYAAGRLRACALCAVGQYRTVSCEDDALGGGQCVDCLTCAQGGQGWTCATHWFAHATATGCTTVSPTPAADYAPVPCAVAKSDGGRHYIVAGCGRESAAFTWWAAPGQYTYESYDKGSDTWQATQNPAQGDRLQAAGQTRTCAYDDGSSCQYNGAAVPRAPAHNFGEYTLLIPYCPPGHYVSADALDTAAAYDVTNCRLCQAACESHRTRAADNTPCDGATSEDTQSRCLDGCDINYYREAGAGAGGGGQCRKCTMCEAGAL